MVLLRFPYDCKRPPDFIRGWLTLAVSRFTEPPLFHSVVLLITFCNLEALKTKIRNLGEDCVTTYVSYLALMGLEMWTFMSSLWSAVVRCGCNCTCISCLVAI